MSRHLVSSLLVAAALLLGDLATSGAQTPPPVAAGTYDSFGREKNFDNTLPRNDRVLKIETLSLGGLRISVFDLAGNLKGRSFLVRKCNVSYDGRLASYYQNFQTVPAQKGTPVEQVEFVFRINDPIGDYDVYFRQPNGTVTSEVIKRR